MNEKRKRPGALFWTILVVVLLAGLYPLSYGPTVWLVRRGRLPNSTIGFYAPMTWLQKDVPGPIGEAVRWYAEIWQ